MLCSSAGKKEALVLDVKFVSLKWWSCAIERLSQVVCGFLGLAARSINLTEERKGEI